MGDRWLQGMWKFWGFPSSAVFPGWGAISGCPWRQGHREMRGSEGSLGAGVRRQAPSPQPSMPGEGGSAPRIRCLTQPGREVPRGDSCPHVLERGQSHQGRAMPGGKALSAWALLASLALASWEVRGESGGVRSVAGHSPWSLDVLGRNPRAW